MLPILFLTVCAVYALLDFWLIRGLRTLRNTQLPEAAADKEPDKDGMESSADAPLISVLVAARDEEDNLPRTLNALLAQDWPADKTEIVVINDRSIDGTAAVLRDYQSRFPGRIQTVEVTELAAGISPKKNALRLGLDVARGSWIAVTDADCTMGSRWLSGLASAFGPADGRTGMVLGLTAYDASPSGQGPAEGARALEFVSYAVTAAALTGLGFPVSANANNLAYRRRAFDEAGGLERHKAVVSGDDDFILQEIQATGAWDIRYVIDSGTQVRTTPPQTWAHFWEQRKRWASKCLLYRAPQIAFLSCIFVFYAAIAALLIAGIFQIGDGTLGLLGLAGFAVKTAADFAVMRAGLNLFGLSSLLRFFPFTALLHIPLVLSAVVAGTLVGFTWKGQKLARRT